MRTFAWLLLGAVFGALAAWGTWIGLYDALTDTRGTPARRLPKAFWRRSAVIALGGAVLGAVLMWRTVVDA
jgi:H+/Cl- antiporter ClcA